MINSADMAAVAAGIPIVIGLVQVAKHSGMPDRYAPLAALVFGIAVGFLLLDDPFSPAGLLTCTVIGLSASGLYDNGKPVIEAIADRQGAA